MSFGNRLRQRRQEKSFTLMALATSTGISYSTLSDYERGIETNPTANNLLLLSETLDVTVDWLLKGTTDGESPVCCPV